MRKPNVAKDEQIRLIMECRNSGLSDYQWCHENDILPGTFYNWIRRLRKLGYVIPDTAVNDEAKPLLQEVVKVSLMDNSTSVVSSVVGQNTSILASCQEPAAAAELVIHGVAVKLYNTASKELITSLIECAGGVSRAW